MGVGVERMEVGGEKSHGTLTSGQDMVAAHLLSHGHYIRQSGSKFKHKWGGPRPALAREANGSSWLLWEGESLSFDHWQAAPAPGDG